MGKGLRPRLDDVEVVMRDVGNRQGLTVLDLCSKQNLKERRVPPPLVLAVALGEVSIQFAKMLRFCHVLGRSLRSPLSTITLRFGSFPGQSVITE